MLKIVGAFSGLTCASLALMHLLTKMDQDLDEPSVNDILDFDEDIERCIYKPHGQQKRVEN